MAEPRIDSGELEGGWGFGTSDDLIAGNPAKHVTLQYPLRCASEHTVQLGLMTGAENPAPGVVLQYAAEAEIFWSCGGNTVRRRVSVKDGMSISGVGEHVKVIVTDKSVFVEGGPEDQIHWPVSILVAPGARGTIQQPPYLEEPAAFTVPAAGASAPILVPRECGVVSVYVTAATPVGTVAADNFLVVDQFTFIQLQKRYDPRNYGWVPISPTATHLILRNATAAEATFNVVWGIDG